MTTATTQRPTEAICPPWCAGHDRLFNPWEVTRANERERAHDSVTTTVAGNNFALTQYEGPNSSMGPVRISTWVDSNNEDLTPAQARELASALLSAAERAEARG